MHERLTRMRKAMIDIQIGDARNLIKEVEDKFFDCIMTSPPYWGLRDYGHADQIGLESTPEEYLKTMLSLFDDIKLKLKDAGNCFVNLGDTYAGSGGAGGDYNNGGLKEGQPRYKQSESNLKAKCLCMIPERFAWGMIEHGWILRNKIIWHKPNHMPESVTDRLTKSHEVIYHFVKQQKYYYNLDAIREPFAESSIKRITQANVMNQARGYKQDDLRGNPDNGNGSRCNKMVQSLAKKHPIDKTLGSPRAREKYVATELREMGAGKNPGDVWSIVTQPYSDAHFAVFPIELVRRPILSGCPPGGHVLDSFGGSGTVAEFCRKNDRDCTIFELNSEYKELINERSMSKYPELGTYIQA